MGAFSWSRSSGRASRSWSTTRSTTSKSSCLPLESEAAESDDGPFVVITAALSSCNGSIYSTGRMLMNLTEQKQAPALFEKTAVQGVPRRALVLTVAGKLIADFPELTNPL
ncbi:hypothetical protein FPT12_13695 [Pseudomonas sp. H3(2019)]|nr:hypothetical protein FPT12_13695 [Pseudomonas sp. H3(2019)]